MIRPPGPKGDLRSVVSRAIDVAKAEGSSAPEAGERRRRDPLAERVRPWPGVQDDAGEEAVAELVSKPGEMLRIRAVGCRVRLDLNPDHPEAAELDQQVDLVLTLFGAEMMQARLLRGDGDLGPQLSGGEAVEDAAEQVTVAGVSPSPGLRNDAAD